MRYLLTFRDVSKYAYHLSTSLLGNYIIVEVLIMELLARCGGIAHRVSSRELASDERRDVQCLHIKRVIPLSVLLL